MSAPLLEQIPQLGDFHRYLEQLALMDPPPAHRDLIIQQVPSILKTQSVLSREVPLYNYLDCKKIGPYILSSVEKLSSSRRLK